MTCERLACLVKEDDELIAMVVTACQRAAMTAQRPDPEKIDTLRKKEKQLNRQIQFLLQNAGETEADQRESMESLKRFRRQRAELLVEVSRLEASSHVAMAVPSEEDVRDLVQKLNEVLSSAVTGDFIAEFAMARHIIELLTGGRIELFQQGERKRHRGWLQGRMRMRLLPCLTEMATGTPATNPDETSEVVIDYRATTVAEQLADKVKALCERGQPIKMVAAELNISRNLATRALTHWYKRNGLPMPDGRSRRWTARETRPFRRTGL
jgi:hypothetical protein